MSIAEPTHRRGKVVDQKILSAVIEVIEASGTLEIKVDEVASVAGVNKTTIYRRFAERDELVLAGILAVAEDVVPIADEGSLAADLTSIAERVRETVTSPLGRALLSASASSPQLAALRPPYWQARFGAAATVFDRAVERGECRAPSNGEMLIELMVAPIHFRASQVGTEITDEFLRLQVDRLLSELES